MNLIQNISKANILKISLLALTLLTGSNLILTYQYFVVLENLYIVLTNILGGQYNG